MASRKQPNDVEQQVRNEMDQVAEKVEAERRQWPQWQADRPGGGGWHAEGRGWECPACGKVYEGAGRCPADDTELRPIGRWEESATARTADEMMELAAQHHPKP